MKSMKWKWLLSIALGMAVGAAASAQSGEELLKAKGCVGCHAPDTKKVGPSYKDIAAKYKGDAKAEEKLVTALKEGKGHPVKVAASEAELKSMVGHILSVK
jgi:cytochrome c